MTPPTVTVAVPSLVARVYAWVTHRRFVAGLLFGVLIGQLLALFYKV